MDKAMLSSPNKVLVGALRLEERNETPFTIGQLSLAAWQEFPKTFGLGGFEEFHPDVNKVSAAICGERGLVKANMLAKIAPGTYTLTILGRSRAYQAATTCHIPVTEKKQLGEPNRATPVQDDFLRRTLDSLALSKATEGADWSEITFTDACQFWGFDSHLTGPAVLEGMTKFHIDLEDVRTATLANREVILANGRSVVSADVQKVRELNDALVKRYQKHLACLRHRRTNSR